MTRCHKFSLVTMVIVIAIVAIMASVVIHGAIYNGYFIILSNLSKEIVSLLF